MKKHVNMRNPLLPLDVHVPDGEAHVMPDGKLYIYGSYDNRDDVYCSTEYHVVSTEDLEHWTVHDTSLRGEDIPWFDNPDYPHYQGIDWSHPTPFILKMLAEHADDKEAFEKQDDQPQPPLLFAPDAIEKDGKYYLYFCMKDDSEGVAVSDHPEGPFADPVQLPCGGIDPAVFIDDDGQAYLYWGQLFSHGVKLNPDMVSFDRKNIVDDLVTEEEHFFHEGSSMRKINGRYYYLYADMQRGKPTALGYSIGDDPLGPFEYRGIIVDNDGCDPASWNNHGSIECFRGQWYVFYHRCSQGTQQHRRLCCEKITINPDGTIDEVKMTSQGAGDPFGPSETIKGYQACQMSGTVYIGADGKGSEHLMNISAGDEVYFRYVKSDQPFSSIRISLKGKGKISVLMNGKEAGTLSFDLQDAKEVSGDISMAPGEYELVLHFDEASDTEIYDVTLG